MAHEHIGSGICLCVSVLKIIPTIYFIADNDWTPKRIVTAVSRTAQYYAFFVSIFVSDSFNFFFNFKVNLYNLLIFLDYVH